MSLLEWESVDRDDPNYKLCIASSTGAGAIIGGAVVGFPTAGTGTPVGYAAGALWGLAIGYLACPYLVPAIRKKIENGSFLTYGETRSAAEAMGRYAKIKYASDAVELVGMIKHTPRQVGKVPACVDPAQTAKKILGHV